MKPSCDPYGLRVQEQPLFLVCSSTTILLLCTKFHRSEIVMLELTKNVVPEPLGHKDHNSVPSFLQHQCT